MNIVSKNNIIFSVPDSILDLREQFDSSTDAEIDSISERYIAALNALLEANRESWFHPQSQTAFVGGSDIAEKKKQSCQEKENWIIDEIHRIKRKKNENLK